MDLLGFNKLPVMGILRDVNPEIIDPLIETIVSSGLKTIEFALNTPGAAATLFRAAKISKKRLTIGAGTVLTMDSLKLALDKGASFIVMPTLIRDIVDYCVKKSIPVFPGALTPQEIYNAWRSGATMVKVFPAKFFGPGYFKEIKGPFKEIKLLACGGVTSENIDSFFESGASAVAFGGSIFKKEWLERKEFSRIGEAIKELVSKTGKKKNE
ncbi:MAG: bifunctional 4-hydroxy-2-oxoglutarate aldolase/2-dehydro-3-deoxy-phosphogluconate aldolase [Candidatus Omnitrophica bacterium]|nr:bifunctional 4-hydroxy-2-oxoglutarate aldolase/2-dehydro-3-deoxy-phosphogluconate aldolase [Candidatus Omnitrophota bacterium]MBU4149743.1 bifunctional 4-hydroxy-2-oxoglutarate aldolase/2-dehydro-3-deoxy-phosphogluconate aldolase [Candidatus Omnitrophota bacterium]